MDGLATNPNLKPENFIIPEVRELPDMNEMDADDNEQERAEIILEDH